MRMPSTAAASPPIWRLAPCWVGLAAAVGLGCARGEAAEERQMNQLREELARVQSERDQAEQRAATAELRTDEKAPPPANTSLYFAASDAGPTPRLRVIRLGPEEPAKEAAAPEPSAPEPKQNGRRPVIRVVGERRPGHRGATSREQVDDVADDGPGPQLGEGPEAPVSSATNPEAKRAYESALALVRAKDYVRALDAFAGFLVHYPDHPYADNAFYWRGECFFAQGDFPRAAEQFEGLLARFPLGNKVSDALLKLGVVYQKLGNEAKAKSYFDRLQREFPRSEAARRVPRVSEASGGSSGRRQESR